jgi:hypothetical protein
VEGGLQLGEDVWVVVEMEEMTPEPADREIKATMEECDRKCRSLLGRDAFASIF